MQPLTGEDLHNSVELNTVIIEHVNEVYAKVTADNGIKQELVDFFTFEVPGAKFMPAYRSRFWDGKVRLYNGQTKKIYKGLVDYCIKFAEERGYKVEKKYNDSDIKETVDYDFNLPFKPRDYQVETINKFVETPQCLQEVATGAGKTIITATLSHICEKIGRTLVIVPNKSLVTQTEEDYVNVGLDVGVYFGDRKELGKTHTICTWQSLNILDKKTKNGEAVLTLAEFLDGIETIIIDEVHQAKAEVLKKLLTQNLRNAPIRWGLTGTIPKEQFEFQSILASIGPVINQISAKELQDKGVLSKCHVNVVQLLDTTVYNSYQEELKYLVTNKDRVKYLAKMCSNIKDSGNTLILVDRISAGEQLQEAIPDSVFIKGDVKLKDRKEQYDEVKEATNKVLIATYGVASVGINIPRIFNLVLIEPGKSFVRVIQSIGRGIRKAEDKDFVQIWDLTSSCKYAKRHLTARKKFYKEAEYPFTLEKLDWQ